MLVVRSLQDIPKKGIQKGDEFRLYIVDAHHHMGKEKMFGDWAGRIIPEDLT